VIGPYRFRVHHVQYVCPEPAVHCVLEENRRLVQAVITRGQVPTRAITNSSH
jgi:hypothetical protein